MRTATITTTSGHTWSTDVNGTDESICEYFLGQWFDVEPYPSERKEQAVSVTIDGKLYSVVWPGYAVEFRLYSRPIPQTQNASADTWFLEVLNDSFSLSTIGIPNDRESGVRMYESFCPGRIVPLKIA